MISVKTTRIITVMPAENTIILKQLPYSFLSDLNGYFIHNVLLIPSCSKEVGRGGWEGGWRKRLGTPEVWW
jgi:hypothetical protein